MFAGWHLCPNADADRIKHRAIACSRPLLSTTCKLNMFGSRVARSSCVARGTEAFRGTIEISGPLEQETP
jgi:hypothetical protein